MKPLSPRQASRCEEAKEPICKCRCGGRLHGAKRGGSDAPPSFYESLPADDPHHIDSEEDQVAKKQAQREARNARKRAETEERWRKRLDVLYTKPVTQEMSQ